jgi:hypothetical protein
MNVGSPTLGGAAIPGDPGGLGSIAARLRSAAEDLSSLQGRVAANELNGWTGAAADTFRTSLNKLPGELGSAAAAFDHAARAVSSFSAELAGLQDRAAFYASRIVALEHELAAAQRRHDEAQSRVSAARFKEAMAHDPVSMKTAVTAVQYGLSLLHQAVGELNLHSEGITRLRHEAQANRENYERAVRACCGQLQDALGAMSNGSGSAHVSISSIIGGIGLFWARRLEGPKEIVDEVHGAIGHIDDIVEKGLPVSKLGRWAVPIVKVANSPLYKATGRLLLPFAVYSNVQDLRSTFNGAQGEDGIGRFVTTAETGAGDAALMLWWPAGAANFIDRGSLNASVHGVALIEGQAASGGVAGARTAYDQAMRSRDYVGLPAHVVGGALGGAKTGALAGDDQFAKNAENGQYGGFVKNLAQTEDFVIEHPGDAADAALHAPADAAKSLYHGGARLFAAL